MALPHYPNLDALEKLPNKEFKFYAIVGCIVSMTATLELALVDIFERSVNCDRALASGLLYPIRNTSTKREMAVYAMTHHVRNDASLAAEWNGIAARIVTVTGNKGERNFVGHNPVRRIFFGGAIGEGAIGEAPIGGGSEEQFAVILPDDRILALKEKPRNSDFKTLLSAAKALKQLLIDLEIFLCKL